MLASILPSTTGSITIVQILLCSLVSLSIGVLIAGVYMYKNVYSKNFVITLAILPVLVQSVIMIVNGNLGTGVAVLGAFSLIRFRSVAGGSREIATIFWSMGVGLSTGMGYLTYTSILSIIVAIALILFTNTKFGESKAVEKNLKIIIPENLDYMNLFDDIFEKYTSNCTLNRVRTTNMGSLYELSYNIRLKDISTEKSLIDELRCRNGNLTIVSGKIATNKEEL